MKEPKENKKIPQDKLSNHKNTKERPKETNKNQIKKQVPTTSNLNKRPSKKQNDN